MVEDSGKKGGGKKISRRREVSRDQSITFLFAIGTSTDRGGSIRRVPETESKRNLVAPLNFIGGFLFRGID